MKCGLLATSTALALSGWIGAAGAAFAQQSWLQIEAKPSLTQAEERARDYSASISGIAGFSMNTGWYAIVIGPFEDPEQARLELRSLRSQRLIPSDSYVSDGSRFGQRFWPGDGQITSPPEPVAADMAQPVPSQQAMAQPGMAQPGLPDHIASMPLSDTTAPAPTAPAAAADAPQQAATAPVTASPAPVTTSLPEETPAQARAAEAALGPDDRRDLQSALAWEGFYDGAIDGLFGPGTRNSMASWQDANGFDATGILTTNQRRALVSGWQKDLKALGLASVTDDEAGIEITLPMALVDFSRYDAPFAQYDQRNGSGVQVVLISQRGDADTLSGLYDLMQGLAVVPRQGPRRLDGSGFRIDAQNDAIASHTEVQLRDGLIKGFLLSWNPADSQKMKPVLEVMQNSFRAIGNHALEASAGVPSATPGTTLVSGLELRQPVKSRTGFYVDKRGTVLTLADTVAGCSSVTLDGGTDAQVITSDAATGLALLRAKGPVSAPAVAQFRNEAAAPGSDIAIAGFAYAKQIDAPVMTFGEIASGSGLTGETDRSRLSLSARPGDSGAPVIDDSGAVTGILLAPPSGDEQSLPHDVRFALKPGPVLNMLQQHGVSATLAQSGSFASLNSADLDRRALKMAVRVSCWK